MIQGKQIQKGSAYWIAISGPTSVSSLSNDITASLTTALSTAGYKGGPVPLQASTSETTIGVITTGHNIVKIYNAANKRIMTKNGNPIYGRITVSFGVYTITFYTLVDGTETAYSFPSPTGVSFLIPYRFTFGTVPTDSVLLEEQMFHGQLDTAITIGRTFKEKLTISGPDTISNLSFTPVSGTAVTLHVNGKEETNTGTNPPFTLAGTVFTWSDANAGYALDTLDIVIATYNTLQ